VKQRTSEHHVEEEQPQQDQGAVRAGGRHGRRLCVWSLGGYRGTDGGAQVVKEKERKEKLMKKRERVRLSASLAALDLLWRRV
jgi:hypothetical protein